MNKFYDLLKHFQEWNPELVKMMQNCSHHFNSEHLSPWHLEDTVWTHTILMYKDFMTHCNNNLIYSSGLRLYLENNDIETIKYLTGIAILCHDIGKIYNRAVNNNKYGKVNFYNHNFSSVQPTIDFMFYLKNECGVQLSRKDFQKVLLAVSGHMNFKEVNIKDRALLVNNNVKGLFIIGLLSYFDNRNSIDSNMDFLNVNMFNIQDYKDIIESEKQPPSLTVDNKEMVTVFCGVPGSGKDFIAEKMLYNIISYDNLRIEKFVKDDSILNDHWLLSEAEIYELAFEYCKNGKYDFNNDIKEALNNSDNVAICNTNLTRKLRRGLFNVTNSENRKFIIYYVVSDSKMIYKRNENRKSKNIDKQIVTRFMYNQQVPCLFDFKDVKEISVEFELLFN
jgi:predicted kinase